MSIRRLAASLIPALVFVSSPGALAQVEDPTFASDGSIRWLGEDGVVKIDPNNHGRAAALVLSASGSYELTGNVIGVSGCNGIEITADNVTLELAGWAVIGKPGALDGILVTTGRVNIHVLDGAVRAWPGDGVDLGLANNSTLAGVLSSHNTGDGIRLRNGTVFGCSARNNGGDGFEGTQNCVFMSCTAEYNTIIGFRTGIDASLGQCTAGFNTQSGFRLSNGASLNACVASNNFAGINGSAANGCTITACTTRNNSSNGLQMGDHAAVNGCSSSDNGGVGILVEDACIVSHCSAAINGGDGIQTGAGSLVLACVSSSNAGDGIQGVGVGATIRDCTAVANTGTSVIGHVVSNCVGATGAGVGFASNGTTGGRFDGNHSYDNATSSYSIADNAYLLVHNSAQSNGAGYVVSAGTVDLAEVLVSPGNLFVATNPWANFIRP